MGVAPSTEGVARARHIAHGLAPNYGLAPHMAHELAPHKEYELAPHKEHELAPHMEHELAPHTEHELALRTAHPPCTLARRVPVIQRVRVDLAGAGRGLKNGRSSTQGEPVRSHQGDMGSASKASYKE